jgi:hypothetical protein
MRHDKIPTVIFTKKEEPQEMVYHCKYHPGCRMVRMSTGLRCQICGNNEIATRTTFTFMKEPVSLSTQELGQKDVNKN